MDKGNRLAERKGHTLGDDEGEYLNFSCMFQMLRLLRFFDFGPGIPQGYRLIKDQFFLG